MNPTVCAVMLTSDRHELATKAVKCFRAQTYDNKSLLVLDTGLDNLEMNHLANEDWNRHPEFHSEPIGSLRNAAMFWTHADIVVHWDDDDWSHPNRIAEQVALLQSSGAEVVGYNEMLFWRGDEECPVCNGGRDDDGGPCQSCNNKRRVTGYANGAWLYKHQTVARPYALGTSLCYWRKTWERGHFANETQGVEEHWLTERKLGSVSSFGSPLSHPGEQLGNWRDDEGIMRPGAFEGYDPRMIARIHAGNTSNGYKLEEYVSRGSKEWQRVPQWDSRVREMLG